MENGRWVTINGRKVFIKDKNAEKKKTIEELLFYTKKFRTNKEDLVNLNHDELYEKYSINAHDKEIISGLIDEHLVEEYKKFKKYLKDGGYDTFNWIWLNSKYQALKEEKEKRGL